MSRREVRLGLALGLASWAALLSAQDVPSEPAAIVVTAKRAEQADVAAEQGKSITLKPSADAPLARHYAPICIKIFGIDPQFGEVIAEQVYRNVRTLKLQAGQSGCAPNVWIGFVSDSKHQVESLRKQEPAIFAEMKSFEIDRVFGGSGGAQVWHATESRSLDGRPIPVMEFQTDTRKIVVKANQQYQGGRLVSPTRTDINGTIVIFDSARANGKTVQQLADYATFRILAPVQDYAEVPERALPTILTLFTPGADPPGGLTEFDWAYLSAYYKLDRGAKASAVHDATKQAVLNGSGQTLSEKAARD